MKFSSTAELRNQANELLHEVEDGEVIVVTRHGKPVAAIQSCREDELEDLVLETSQAIRRSVERAADDIQRGRGISLNEYQARSRRRQVGRR